MTHKDSENNLEIISSTKLMMMNSGTGIHHEETVPNDGAEVEMLQIFIRPEEDGLQPSVQFHDLANERSVNQWRLLAGHKASEAPLLVNSQLTVFDNHLTQASEVILEKNTKAVVYVFEGEVASGDDLMLGKGDSLVADESLELKPLSSSVDLLLFKLNENAPFSRSGVYSG